MNNFTDKEFKTFDTLVKMDKYSLKNALVRILNTYNYEVIDNGDSVIGKGIIPIALVAHLDTVFPTGPTNVRYNKKTGIVWSPTGLGADDRAGVYAIIEIIKSGLKPHIIFTTDEEIGDYSAARLASKECPFKLNYMIELDRQGKCDCVFYNCNNTDFIKYVESFGFIEDFGTFSDISVFCPAWKVAGVNLSVGYKNEHSVKEVLYSNVLKATIEKVKKMLIDENMRFFDYIPYVGYLSHFGLKVCSKCNQYYLEEEMYPVLQENGSKKNYCIDCLVDSPIEWCSYCGEPFQGGYGKLCKKCRRIIYDAVRSTSKESISILPGDIREGY